MKNIKNQISKFIKELLKDIVKNWIILSISTITITGLAIFGHNLWRVDLNIKALWLIFLLPLCVVFGFMQGIPKRKKRTPLS